MFCSISGEVPEDPVVSRKTGHLYEKRLIEKYLREDGKCPISGEELTEADLIELKANKAVRPRQVTSTSIPALLTTLQNEWDEVMLETFTLKQHLDATRRELSQALYQHDAACRVISRLMRERDEARSLLSTLQAHGATSARQAPTSSVGSSADEMVIAGGADDVVDGEGQSSPAEWAAVTARMESRMKELHSGRKGRKPAPTLVPKDRLESLSCACSITPHKSDKAGVTCLALKVQAGGDTVLLSGGVDRGLVLTNVSVSDGRAAQKATTTPLGKVDAAHAKRVSCVAFHPDSSSFLSASEDKTVKVWSLASPSDTTYTQAVSLSLSDEVVGLCVHPLGIYAACVVKDGSWAFLDVAAGRCLRRVPTRTGEAPLEHLCGALHPDGLLLGTGTSTGSVKIWDVREAKLATELADHQGGVHSVAFSENGYLVATGDGSGELRLWDLRKSSVTQTASVSTSSVKSVSLDYSGSYLAATGGPKGCGLVVKAVKDWSASLGGEVQTLAHSKAVTALAWGPNATFLASCGMDRAVKIFVPTD